MQFLHDFWPIIVFFVTYKLAGIYWATVAIIISMAVQIVVQWIRTRTVNKMLLVSGGLVFVFGGATLLLQDRIFIQWKPTIVNWLFAAAFLASHFIGKRITVAERVMGEGLELPSQVWSQVNAIWVVYFLVLGAANLFVVYNFSEEIWVNFKLFGTLAFTLLLVLIMALWINWKHPSKESS